MPEGSHVGEEVLCTRLVGIGRHGWGELKEWVRTGAIADSSLSSRTFSMADFEGSMGGVLTRTRRSAMVVAALKKERAFVRYWCGLGSGIAIESIRIWDRR